MKKSFVLLSFILTLIYVGVSAQTPTIKPFKLNEKQVLSKSSIYQGNLNYSEFTLDKNEIGKINQNINRCNIEFTLSNNKTLVAVLHKFDIWDKDFEVKNEKGEKIIVEKGNVFQGYLEDDTTSRVAVSIFKDVIDILIETKQGKYNLKNDSKDNTYKFEDVVNTENIVCPVNDKLDIQSDGNPPNATNGCKTFTIRVVTDLNMLNFYGTTTAVYQRVVTIFNQMIIPYQEQSVGVKLASVNTFTSAPPFDYSNNSSLLNSFNSWYYANLSGANMGHLFTTVSFSGVIGTAWINNICSGTQPHTGWSEVDEPYGYLVVAHEIGHNLGSSHTNSSSIMDPTVNSGYSFDAPTGTLFRSGLNSCGQVDNSGPADLQSSSINVTSAVLTWARTPTSTNYSAYYRKVGDTNFTEVVVGSGTTATLTGLLSGVRYEWTAQGDCSNISNLRGFTTLINATLNTTLSASGYCPNEAFSINIATTGVINGGNIFKAQISDVNGNFGTPIEIGSNTSNTSGNFTATIPSYVSAGSNYKIRVVSTYPEVVGNLMNVVIKPSPPKPTLSLSSSNLFCNNNPVSITASNCSGTLTWNTPISATGNTVSVLPTNNFSYSAKCTGTNGCFSEGITPTFKKIEAGAQNSILQWEKSFGGTADDFFTDMIKTADGGYLLVGESYSGADGNKTQLQRGAGDVMVIKIDANGNKVWEKIFGGTGRDFINRIVQTSDNNYLLLLSSASGIGYEKTSASKGGLDNWIIKITPNGDIIWQSSIGSDVHEYIRDVELTADGGYIFLSYIAPLSPATGAPNGDRTQAMKSAANDCWIFKLDANGVKVWDKIYGGTGNENMVGIEKAVDNSGYFITGGTTSASGANSDITTSARHDYDAWLLKIDEDGNKLFDKTYSGGLAKSPYGSPEISYELIYQIRPLPDGNYILSMISNNHAGFEKSENCVGGLDLWLMKITPNGTKIADKVIGGVNNEDFGDLIVLNDGNILLASATQSPTNIDRNNEALKGTSDALVVKLDPNLNIIYSKTFGGNIGTDINRPEYIFKILNEGNDNFVFVGFSSESKGDRADAFGLQDGWVMKVNIPSITKPTISATNTVYCPGEPITLTVTGCSSNILWSNGATTNSIIVKPNSDANTYRLNCITNANACIGVDSDVFKIPISSGGLNLSGIATSGTKQAKNTIVSNETINSGINVNYRAGNSILLDKNQSFEAKSGSIFKAEIAPCAIENGLLARYDFSNNILDQSGNNRNGLVNTALFTKDRFGNSNSALSFNGVNQYVTLGNWFNYQEFTVSFWVSAGATQANAYAELIDNNHTGSRSWLAQQDNTTNNLYYFGAIGSPTGTVLFNLTSTWNHLTFVKGAGIIKVFLNGKLVSTTPHGGNIPYDGTQNLILGAWYSGGNFNRFWNGKMDDLKLYNRALSDTEITTIFQAEAPNPSLNTGLSANYKFDGDANDVSGKGNIGGIIGGATFTTDRFGQANKALNFDGIDDFVSVPNNPSLSGFNELTLSAWVSQNQLSGTLGAIVSKWYQQIGQDTYVMSLYGGTNKLYGNTNNTYNSVLESTNTVPINTWIQVTFTHDSSGDKLYINGAITNSNTVPGNIISSNTNLLIGADSNLGTIWRFFKGKIDDVRLYNRALSPLEVIQLYEVEKP